MRIAGGVLIIIVAVMNLVGGCGYVAGGALVGGVGGMMEAGGDEGGVEEEGAELADAGGNAVMFGYFKLALAALEIATGVVLFVGTAAMLAKVTAGLEIINVGIGATVFIGVSVFSALGLIGAILAFLGAQQIGAAATGGGGGAAPPPADPPPVAAPPAEG